MNRRTSEWLMKKQSISGVPPLISDKPSGKMPLLPYAKHLSEGTRYGRIGISAASASCIPNE